MLRIFVGKYYRVKRGQTVQDVAAAFGVAVAVLIRENGLQSEIREGALLRIPDNRGNRYVAQAGDSKRLLCGSDERYFQKNGTHILYPGMTVIL